MGRTPLSRCLALAAGACLAPIAGRAQQPVSLYFEGAVAAARVRSGAGTVLEPLDGAVFSVAGGASRSGVVLEGRYAQGRLTSESPTVEARDLVEGELRFGVRLHPAVTVTAGPHVRAYASSSGTRRWVFWEARIRGTAPIIPSRLDAYAELWGAVAGSTSLSTGFGSERGGEVGTRLEIPRTPLALRVAYRIDRGSGNNPTRSDMAEQIVVAVRAARR